MSDLGNKAIMAENIKHYMEISNKSRNDMCEALGLKYSTFTDWVNGKKYPRIDKIELMANYFGIEKSDLVEKRNKDLPEGAFPYIPEPMVNIPLIGCVNCGTPLFAEDNIEGYIPTPKSDIQTGETYFWLRAKGDSMINVGIQNGDLLLIRQQADVNNGDIAVVVINGDEATLKRVKKQENAIILQPENPSYDPQVFVGKDMAEISIRGRLMQLRKEF